MEDGIAAEPRHLLETFSIGGEMGKVGQDWHEQKHGEGKVFHIYVGIEEGQADTLGLRNNEVNKL